MTPHVVMELRQMDTWWSWLRTNVEMTSQYWKPLGVHSADLWGPRLRNCSSEILCDHPLELICDAEERDLEKAPTQHFYSTNESILEQVKSEDASGMKPRVFGKCWAARWRWFTWILKGVWHFFLHIALRVSSFLECSICLKRGDGFQIIDLPLPFWKKKKKKVTVWGFFKWHFTKKELCICFRMLCFQFWVNL